MNLPTDSNFENQPERASADSSPDAGPQSAPLKKVVVENAAHSQTEFQRLAEREFAQQQIAESQQAQQAEYHSSRRKIHVKPQPNDGFFGRIVWLCVAAAFVLIIWHIGPAVVEKYKFAETKGIVRAKYENAVEQLKDQPLNNVSLAYQLVAQKVKPSVVSIRAISESKTRGAQSQIPGLMLPPRGQDPRGQGRQRQQPGLDQGQGSGVIMSEEGYVLTNAHVVDGARLIEVVLHDRRSYIATQVGTSDVTNDLAVLKIEATDLVPAEWGDSDSLEVGSIVWAIGSPYGLEQSVTSGIVSAKNRFDESNPQQQLMQTDAAVNPGNSGGPLVNTQGAVVGINTAIYGDKFQGISFAVPSSVAQWIYDQITSKGYASRSMLGVRPTPVFQRDVEKYNLPDIDGAMIALVQRGSPADVAGLKEFDVVRSWDGKAVVNYGDLYRFVAMTEPDSTVKIEFIRDGQLYNADVTVSSADLTVRRQ